jgi:hypothetical protein
MRVVLDGADAVFRVSGVITAYVTAEIAWRPLTTPFLWPPPDHQFMNLPALMMGKRFENAFRTNIIR